MPHDHTHDHDHDHDHPPGQSAGTIDPHAHRDRAETEEPFDAANQSLADALRSSFSILKVIMLVLVGLYLISNVRSVGGHEEALVLRLGKLQPKVRDAGLVKALPIPIDEIVRLPTRKSNEMLVESQSFQRREDEIGKALSFISRGEHQGLNPSEDGALLTADSGLVHAKWKVTYKIANVVDFVTHFAGDRVEAAETLLRPLVETTAIRLATQRTAGEFIRTRLAEVQEEMKVLINARLAELSSGVNVTLVEMFEPTPPLQIRNVFDETQRAENAKQRRIQDAEQQRIRILSEAAGGSHVKLIGLLDSIDGAVVGSPQRREWEADLNRVLENEIEGMAGKWIRDAGAYHSVVVGQMQSDLEEYRALLPEFERNRDLLFGRLWQKTREAIFDNPGVVKIYRPSGAKEFRLVIPLDPEQTRQQEEERIQKKDSDVSRLRPPTYHPASPENE